MYCRTCCTEIYDDVRFCPNCGSETGKGAATSSAQTEPRWEYCEITWTKAGWLEMGCFFWAKGIGPRGVSEVARGSKKFIVGSTILGPDPSREDKKTVAACDELINTLVSSGWEPLSEKGSDWWSYKFRRQANRSMSGNISTGSSTGRGETNEQWLKRGNILFEQKQYTKAIEAFGYAIRLDPEESGAYFWRGWSLYLTERYQESIADFDRTIELTPYFGGAFKMRGRAKFELKQYQEAVTDFNMAILLNDALPPAIQMKQDETYLYRGFAYTMLQQYQMALADFDAALRLSPNDAKIQNARELVYRFLKQKG